LNAERVATDRIASRNGEYQIIGRHQGWSTTPPSRSPRPMISPNTPSTEVAASDVASQEDVYSLLRERADFHAQVFDAAQIQRKLSGPRMLRVGDLQFANEVFAARFVSGDFTTLSQDGSRVLTVLGDIAGKGIAAGMWFTHLAGLLQSYGRPESDPSRIAAEINRHLCYLRPVAPFVTAFFALIDCAHGKLTYCNAGHFLPILLRADGRTSLLDIGGPLLGAIDGAEYRTGELVLEPGDTLVAYSDGVIECRSPADEEFGTDRLIAALRQTEQQSAHATLMMLLAAVQDFANGHPLCDDLSLTVIQRDGMGAGKISSVKSEPWAGRLVRASGA
jgi:serine phosphatase RsbU (regulator of sigma subunit)